jgi:hypothetical protein
MLSVTNMKQGRAVGSEIDTSPTYCAQNKNHTPYEQDSSILMERHGEATR